MTNKELTELCKNAFGWSGSVIRHTQKSLLAQGLAKQENGLWVALVEKQDLEDQNWSQWVDTTFQWTPPATPTDEEKPRNKRSIWFWTTWAAALIAVVLGVLLLIPSKNATFPSELQLCKDALDQWQACESYYITQSTQFQLKTNEDSPLIYQWYYVGKTDWMYLSVNWNDPDAAGYPNYLYRDGQLYSAQNCKNRVWVPSTTNLPSAPLPWPMTFTWENCELIYLSTFTKSGETLVRFQIIDRSKKVTQIYHATFYFTSQQQLYCIQLTSIESESQVRVDVFTLTSSDPDMIAEAIASQHTS